MNKSLVYKIIVVVVLFLLQVLICNRIALWGYATLFIMLYPLLKIPSGTSPYYAMTLAFIWGLLTDIFTNTLGMYALASVSVAFVHSFLVNHIQYRERSDESFTPSVKTLGWRGYSLYTIILALIFSTILFCVESFSFFEPSVIVGRIFASTLFTAGVMMIVEWIYKTRG